MCSCTRLVGTPFRKKKKIARCDEGRVGAPYHDKPVCVGGSCGFSRLEGVVVVGKVCCVKRSD